MKNTTIANWLDLRKSSLPLYQEFDQYGNAYCLVQKLCVRTGLIFGFLGLAA